MTASGVHDSKGVTMRQIRFCLLLFVSAAIGLANAQAADAALENTTAFEQAYAASFYQFDACGDGIAGQTYRKALVDRLKQCPFSAEAKKRFLGGLAAQRRTSSRAMSALIGEHGGLPVRLDGMTRSCREQVESPEYRLVRGRLDAYAAGHSTADAVMAQPCDAAEITP